MDPRTKAEDLLAWADRGDYNTIGQLATAWAILALCDRMDELSYLYGPQPLEELIDDPEEDPDEG